MPLKATPRRFALLAAALLSACAAGEGEEGPPRVTGFGPTGAYGNYLVGRYATTEADSRVAADAMLQALRAEPNQPEVVARAFIAALLDNRPEASRLARALPDNPLAVLLLAGNDAQAGRWERAEQRLRGLNRAGPVQVLVPVLTAWTLLGRNQPDQALALLRPLAEGGRLRALHALHAALIADIAGRTREAERYARLAAADQPEPALRLALLSAGVLTRAGKPQDAARLLDQAGQAGDEPALVVAEPNRRALLAARGVASPTDGMAEAYVALASAVRGQGAQDMSLVLVRLALRLRPGFGAAVLLASEALSDNHPEEALAQLNSLAAEDPLAPVVELRRAALLDKLDRVDDAVALLRRVAEAQPGLPQAPARLGDLLRRRSRFPEAAEAYNQALARIGRLQGHDWPLLYARGIARERSGDWTRAEADFLHALELSPEQPYVLNYLGYTWADQGKNLERARAMLQRATELRPQDGNIADSLGWVLFRQGDIAGAVTWLEKAVELEPRSSVINDHLGDAYWAAGRTREAQFQWRRALLLEPEPGEGPKIEAKLRDGLPGYPAAHAQR